MIRQNQVIINLKLFKISVDKQKDIEYNKNIRYLKGGFLI